MRPQRLARLARDRPERLSFIAVEFDRYLGPELRAGAVDARRTLNLLQEACHLLGVRRGISTGYVGHEKVDRLSVSACCRRRRNRDRLNVRGQILPSDFAELRHPVACRMRRLVFKPDVDLADVALRDESPERSRIGAGHGGVCEHIGRFQDLSLQSKDSLFRRFESECRSDRSIG